jgi:hypothetical protein
MSLAWITVVRVTSPAMKWGLDDRRGCRREGGRMRRGIALLVFLALGGAACTEGPTVAIGADSPTGSPTPEMTPSMTPSLVPPVETIVMRREGRTVTATIVDTATGTETVVGTKTITDTDVRYSTATRTNTATATTTTTKTRTRTVTAPPETRTETATVTDTVTDTVTETVTETTGPPGPP